MCSFDIAPLALEQFLTGGPARYSRPVLGLVCFSPEISHFLEESYIFSVENAVWKPRCGCLRLLWEMENSLGVWGRLQAVLRPGPGGAPGPFMTPQHLACDIPLMGMRRWGWAFLGASASWLGKDSHKERIASQMELAEREVCEAGTFFPHKMELSP